MIYVNYFCYLLIAYNISNENLFFSVISIINTNLFLLIVIKKL